MKRKVLSLLLCAAMATSMLAGCGSKEDSAGDNKDAPGDAKTASDDSGDTGDAEGDDTKGDGEDAAGGSDEVVKLTLWGAEEDQDLLKDLVGKFEDAYASQKFDIQIGVESESTAMDTVLKDVEAAADVYAFASDQLPKLVKAGALADLDSIGEALTVADKKVEDVKNANMPASIEAASSDGKLYAFPFAGDNSYFMYYDASVLSEEDVKSWDSLLAAAQKGGKKVGMTYASGWYLASFFYGAGFTTKLNEDGTTSMDWNGESADGYKGTDVVKSMIKIASDPAFLPFADGQSANVLASGDVCAVISGTWDAQTAEKIFGENYEAVKLPTFTVGDDQVQMKPAYGYKFIGVNAYAKNSGWAAVLADFLTNEESQLERFQKRQIGPTNLNVLEMDEISQNKALAAVTSEADFGVIQLVGGKYWDPVKTYGEMLTQGKLKESDEAGIQKSLDTLVEGVTAPVN